MDFASPDGPVVRDASAITGFEIVVDGLTLPLFAELDVP